MLTAKYEKYELLKDQYLAEMVFKYDKNLGFLATYDKKGREIIHSITALINHSEDIGKVMPQINLMYSQLDEIS